MPLYDYRCRACGHEFEEIKPAALKGPIKCSKCRARRAARVFVAGRAPLVIVKHDPGSARLNRGRGRR